MTSFREAIFAQPENLAAAADAFAQAVSSVDLERFSGGTLVVGAMGASMSAAIPFVRGLRAAGRRAFLLSATEVTRELGDVFVLVSQSGASTETVDAVARLDGAPVLAVSAAGDSPVAGAATGWLPLGPMPDTPVATLSYTATLQTLGMLGDQLLGAGGDGWPALPDLAASVLRSADPAAAELAPAFAKVSVVDAVGGDSGEASAHEAALLVREGLRLPATGMQTRSYLHGPMEAVATGLGAFVFGGGARERELAAELAGFGATVAFVGDRAAAAEPAVTSFVLPPVAPVAAPILEILPIQLLAEHVAGLLGLPIGELRRSQPDTKVGR